VVRGPPALSDDPPRIEGNRMIRPRAVATVKSEPRPGKEERVWRARCLLHVKPTLISVFGTVSERWFLAHSSRESATSSLAFHQTREHPCVGCAGLDCHTCRGTGVDLTRKEPAPMT
jgi:hypothetical protein